MTATLPAARLAYDHIGSRVSWAIPDPEALFEDETPIGTLDWISHTQGATVLGVTFIEDAERGTPEHRITLLEGRRVVITSDDYWLDPRTSVTVHPDDPTDVTAARGGRDRTPRAHLKDMNDQQQGEPAEGEKRDYTFTAVGGEPVTVTAEYDTTWGDELRPCLDLDAVCEIFDAWVAVDPDRRSYRFPSTERDDDDLLFAYVDHEGKVVLDSWKTTTESDRWSLDDLPGLLPRDHYALEPADQPLADAAPVPDPPAVDAGPPPLAPPAAARRSSPAKPQGPSLGS